MYKLDWQKINNDKDFQRLVNDIASHELDCPGFLPSSPYIGADGGWDGRYEGIYQKIQGLWSFQSKWTKHNLDNACKQLKDLLKEELKKSKKNEVDYLVFATNADLRMRHVKELKKSNNKHVKNLYIWPREKLEELINKWSWVRYHYFGVSQYPKFIPPDIYFFKEKLVNVNTINRNKEYKEIYKTFEEKKNNLSIIHAPGGFGKSHFLKDFVNYYYSKGAKRQVLFCKPDIGDFDRAIDNNLNSDHSYILVLDDAERYLEDAKKMISLAQQFDPEKIKILLSCRTSGKEIIQSILNLHELSVNSYSFHKIKNLPEKDLTELLKSISGKKIEKKKAKVIIKDLASNLYLLVSTARLIKKDKKIDIKVIKNKVRESLYNETCVILDEELKKDKIKILLREIAVIIPIPEYKDKELETLSIVLSLDKDKIINLFNKLEKAGILRKVGGSLRFNPDMKGDLFLSLDFDSDKGEQAIDDILERWLPICPNRVIANIADASRHSDTKNAKKVVSRFIDSLINKIDKTDEYEASSNLKLVSRLFFIAPDKILDMLYIYLEKFSSNISRDDMGQVVNNLIHIKGFQKKIINFVYDMTQAGLKGTYNNYEAKTLIQKLTSPIKLDLIQVQDSIDELLKWVGDENCSKLKAELVSYGAEEALAASHEHTENYGITLTFGKRTLIYEGKQKELIDKYREKAMQIFKKLLFHPKKENRIFAIKIIDNIGKGGTASKEFKERVFKDKELAVELIGELLETEKIDFALLNDIENVLLRVWGSNNIYPEISKKAANILRGIKRGPEYAIFSYFYTHDIVIKNFKKIEDNAPNDSTRWSWLVHNHFRHFELKKGELDNVVKEIATLYPKKEDIIKYLNKLSKTIGNNIRNPYIPLIEIWSKFNKEELIAIVELPDFEDKISRIFYRGFYRVITRSDPSFIKKYVKTILSDIEKMKSVERVDILTDITNPEDVTIDEYVEWMIKIIKNTSNDVKSILLHRNYFIFNEKYPEDRERIVDILNAVLESGVDNNVLNNFGFLYSHLKDWGVKVESDSPLFKKLYPIIKNIDKIDFHVDELLKYIFDGDIKKYIEFVEYRLREYKKRTDDKSWNYDAIPFNGFKSNEGLIKSYEDYKLLMDKMYDWDKEGIIYSFDKKSITNFRRKPDTDTENYLLQYIDEKIAENTKDGLLKTISSLHCVHIENSTSDLFLNTLQKSHAFDLFQEAKQVLSYQVFTGSYSSQVGEAPPALVNKKNVLEGMSDKCIPGEDKMFINGLIKDLDDNIQRHINEGEEMKNPKN